VSVYALVVLVPLAGAAVVPFASLLGPRVRYWFANLLGLATAILALSLIPQTGRGTELLTEWIPGLVNLTVFTDALSLFLVLIAGVIGALICLYSVKYMEGQKDLTYYYSMLVLFIGSMIGLALTSNLLILYFFWEVVGLCSYALIGFYYEDPKAARAGMKAFLTTRVGDVGLLVGILVLYFTAGRTFDIPAIMKSVAAGAVPAWALATAAFGFLAGAVGKSAQVPLHVWLPDAMEAPTTISALIHAATMVNAGIYLVARTFPLFSGVAGWAAALCWIGAITAFLAATMALVEPDLKRLLAYSTISQLGYMMLAVGVGGLFASQFHLLSHAVFKALLFLCAGAVIHEAGTRNMYEMGGLGRYMRITAPCFLIGSLALAGIPIFNGFWSKDLIFAAALNGGFIGPLVLAVITAVLTVAYAFRGYYLVFCGTEGPHVHEAPAAMTVPLVTLASGAVLSWLLAGFQSTSLETSGLHVEAMSLGTFLAHTFTEPALLLSLLALACGLLIYWFRRDVGGWLKESAPSVAGAIGCGYGFDALYFAILRGLFAVAAVLRISIEAGLDAVNYLTARLVAWLGHWTRKLQTGDAAFNTLGVVLGLVLILAVIYLV